MSDPIEFNAQVYKVQTLATDGGIRVTLDLPETAIMQMAMLAECQRAGVYLQLTAQPTLTDLDDATKKEPEGTSPKVDNRGSRKRRDQRKSCGI